MGEIIMKNTKSVEKEVTGITPAWAKELTMVQLTAVNYIVAREMLSRMQQIGSGRIPV